MLDVERARERVEGGDALALRLVRVDDVRHASLAASPGDEEGLLDVGRPAQRGQDADTAGQVDELAIGVREGGEGARVCLSLIHISEPTRLLSISYAVFCLKKK